MEITASDIGMVNYSRNTIKPPMIYSYSQMKLLKPSTIILKILKYSY